MCPMRRRIHVCVCAHAHAKFIRKEGVNGVCVCVSLCVSVCLCLCVSVCLCFSRSFCVQIMYAHYNNQNRGQGR